MGYNINLDNVAIGREKTINEIRRITVLQIPYSFLISLKIVNPNYPNYQLSTINPQLTSVSHPNPAEYLVNLELRMTNDELNNENNQQLTTLILSQSYNDGWLAFSIQNSEFRIQNWLNYTFPYIFGKRLTNHVLVNNWENGWIIDNKTQRQEDYKTDNFTILPSQSLTVYIFFWPQVLEFLGFALLPLPFLWLLKKN